MRINKAKDNSKLPLDNSAHLRGLQFQLTEIEFNATYNTKDIEAPSAVDRAISVQSLLPKVCVVAMLEWTTLPIVRCITILM